MAARVFACCAASARSLFVLALSTRAGAESEDDTVAKITQMNKDAVAALQAQKFDDARKILKQALDLADSTGLQQHPITARTHIHMGIVIISGFKQRELGIKQFKKALEIQSTINLTKALVTPELTDAFNEAKGGAPPPRRPPVPPPVPAPSRRGADRAGDAAGRDRSARAERRAVRDRSPADHRRRRRGAPSRSPSGCSPT